MLTSFYVTQCDEIHTSIICCRQHSGYFWCKNTNVVFPFLFNILDICIFRILNNYCMLMMQYCLVCNFCQVLGGCQAMQSQHKIACIIKVLHLKSIRCCEIKMIQCFYKTLQEHKLQMGLFICWQVAARQHNDTPRYR